MKGLAWKLATVAAVMGIGFLVLLQAQRGMNQASLSKPGDAQTTALGPAASPPDSAAGTKFPPDIAQPNSQLAQTNPEPAPAKAVPDLPFQSEPQPTAQLKSPAVPATASLPSAPFTSKPDAAPAPIKTAESAAASPANSAAPPGGDPFGDFNDAKHAVPGESSKTAAAPSTPGKKPGADAIPASDVRQAAASAEENSAQPGAVKPSAGNAPTPAAASSPAGGAPALPELKAPVGQPEPADSAPPPRPSDQSGPPKDIAKDTAGPQLFVPGTGSDSPAAASSQPKPADQGTSSPPPNADGGKKEPSGPTLAKGNAEPEPFPALDDEPVPTAGAAAPGKNNPKPASPALAAPAPLAHPDPFPVDQAKEVPLPKPSETKTADAGPSRNVKPPGQANAVQLPSPKSADSSAPAVAQAPPRQSPDSHPEPGPGPDFQGDGTIGEQAPLGPQRPQLNIEKVAPQNALIGQPLIYSILVKNVGNSEAHDVVVEDRIPKGTRLSGTNPQAELTGKKLIWRIGTLVPAEQRRISIRVIPFEAGDIGSVATVNFVSEAAAETVVTAPRLAFELSAPKDVKLGAMVPFHFKVTNVGTGEARGVVIRDLIPEGLSHAAGNDLEYEIGRLPPGKSRELTLDLKAARIGPTVNKALVVGEGGLSVRAQAAIEISGSKIALMRSGPPRRYLGRPAIYANTIVNESKYEVAGVIAVETVPPGMDFAGATHGGQFNEGSRTIAWRIDRMLPNETCIVKSKLIPKATGTQTSTVRISVPDGESTEASSQTVVEGFAALGVDVAGADGPVDVGEKVTLRVNARNKGTVAATNVVVTVEIPEQMTVISVRGPRHKQEGRQVQFGPMPALEGRTEAFCEVVLQAAKRGDSRIRVSLRADQVDKPLTREESVLVLSESAEPAAAR